MVSLDPSRAMDLSGCVALVTGASRGIGRAIAIELARHGAAVGINYTQSEPDAESVAAEVADLGAEAVVVQADVSDVDAVDRMFAAVEGRLGPVSVLVNSAGVETYGTIYQLSIEDWLRVQAVNLNGPFYTTRRALSHMPTGGSIINISSIHGSVARRGAAHYCASKAGLEMFTRTVALEVASRGIRVNCIAPGAILTDMNRDLIEEIGTAKWREWIPLGRVGTTAEVAALTTFLASGAASYITGEVITIDGAYSLNLVRYD